VIELPILFPHQEDQKNRARAALARHGRVILTAPPGVGKTRMAKWILGSSANRTPTERQSGRSLFTVHRRGLVDNAVQSFCEAPELPHGVIMSGHETAYGRRIQVASIDSLLSWFIEDGDYPSDITFDLITFDECHSHHQKLAKLLKYHDARRKALGLHPAYVIGLTATPQARGLSDTYKEIVPGPPTQWLIDNGYLSPFRYFRATQGKLDLLVKRGSEFTNQSVSDAMDGLAGDLVRDWKLYAEGRPTVGFFPRRTHAKAAMRELSDAGLKVEYVDGNTDDDKRRDIFRALNEHWIDYLCNVQVVERGTDIPRIGCVQVCVAVASLVRWRQMIGRGSRRHHAKTDVVVLDHGGNIKRGLGFFEDDPHWTLDITTKDAGDVGPRPTIECPKCNAIYRGGRCSNCGYEPTPRERRGQGLEFDGSELVEVKRSETKPRKVHTSEELMVKAMQACGKRKLTWGQCVGFFHKLNRQQGTHYTVPRTVNIGKNRYATASADDRGRLVETLYPCTLVRGCHGGDYLIHEQETVGAPY
jgi:DNA repair protein RadD